MARLGQEEEPAPRIARPAVEAPRAFGCLPGGGSSGSGGAPKQRQKAAGPSFSQEELQRLSEEVAGRVKAAVMRELGQELKGLSSAVKGQEASLCSHADAIGALEHEVRSLRREVRALQATCEELSTSRGFLSGWLHICSGTGPWRSGSASHLSSSASFGRWQSSVRNSSGNLEVIQTGQRPREADCLEVAESAPAAAAAVGPGFASPQHDAPGGRTAELQESGLLGPALERFGAAVSLDAKKQEAVEVRREPFFEGLEALAQALDGMGGGMGGYLASNVKKLRRSKASQAEECYEAWLLSELPVHAANGYKEYLDDSAFMANLWIAWTLELFVEMFALLREGKEFKACVDAAYKQTLQKHHNFLQRAAFAAAAKRLPSRERVLQSLGAGGGQAAADRDLAAFVAVGRPLVRLCVRLHGEACERMQAARAARP